MIAAGYDPRYDGRGTDGWDAFSPECMNCHDPHGDGANISMIQKELYDKVVFNLPTQTPPAAPTEQLSLVFTDNASGLETNGWSYADSTTPWSSICQECHEGATPGTDTTRGFLDDNATVGGNYSGHPSYLGSQADNPGDCSGCHKHNSGFKPQGCSGCHGGDKNTGGWTNNNFWPAAGSIYPKRPGEHEVHINQLMLKLGYTAATITDQQQKTMCAYCHTYTTAPGEGGHDDNVAPADVGNLNPMWSALTANYPSTADGGTAGSISMARTIARPRRTGAGAKAPPKAGAAAMSVPGLATRMPSCAMVENSFTAPAPAAAG